jgi:hypothetical protein
LEPRGNFANMSIDFSKTEEETLRHWQEIDAFQTQLRLTEGGKRFTFYDGPPFGMLSLSFCFVTMEYLLTGWTHSYQYEPFPPQSLRSDHV